MTYQPKIIGSVVGRSEIKPAPTVISFEPKSDPRPTVTPQVTRIGGQQRIGIDMSIDDLKTKFTNASDDQLVVLKQKLSSYVIETLDMAELMKIGNDNQENFTTMLADSLLLVQNDSIRQVQHHISRMIDLMNDSTEKLNEPGGLFRKKADPLEIFQNIQREISQLKSLLKGSLTTIGSVIKSHLTNMKMCDTIENAAKMDIMLIDVLVEKAKQDHIDVLNSRTISIGQTLTQITNQRLVYQSSVDSLNKLVDLINDTLNLYFPKLLQCIMSLDPNQGLTDTQRYIATDEMKNFVNFLKRN